MTTNPIPTRHCNFCDRGHTMDAGGSYDRARCEADHLVSQIGRLRLLRDQLSDPKNRAAVEDDIRRAERRLEQVRYVGD